MSSHCLFSSRSYPRRAGGQQTCPVHRHVEKGQILRTSLSLWHLTYNCTATRHTSAALYQTIAASIHIIPSCGILDSVLRYNTSLDCLIRHCAVFGALKARYAVPCCLTRLRPGKDGSSPYSTLSGRFLRLSSSRTLSQSPNGSGKDLITMRPNSLYISNISALTIHRILQEVVRPFHADTTLGKYLTIMRPNPLRSTVRPNSISVRAT